jgi:hypothetical protein
MLGLKLELVHLLIGGFEGLGQQFILLLSPIAGFGVQFLLHIRIVFVLHRIQIGDSNLLSRH